MSANTASSTYSFQTEVQQLLQLVIHSLYSNKEIFLRELISNASDALDKRRLIGLHDTKVGQSQPMIEIKVDKQTGTLSIRDNGIGMTREEAISNLGTIAKSGTKEFLKKFGQSKDGSAQQIGQFGVGFYASFIVADEVIVRTRHALSAAHDGVEWRSTGDGQFSIRPLENVEIGTEVILHLKAEDREFLEGIRLRQIIRKYSDHIQFPIQMTVEKTEESAATDSPEWETVNQATALWTLSKNQITQQEYREFYKYLTHDFDNPLSWTHHRVEGAHEYTLLLYLPANAPFDLWNRDRTSGLRLYVQRVFIMDGAEQFLPNYLRFVRGIIDSADLPLNVSREILQSNRFVEQIKTNATKKILSLLTDLATQEPAKYQKFWDEFGEVFKEGPAEDYNNRETLLDLLRFSSSHKEKLQQDVSLSDYVSRMPAHQEKIYYITAENFEAAKNSPQLEIFRQKKIEVLLLWHRVDEWLMSQFSEYKGKTLQSVAKGSLDLDQIPDTEEDSNTPPTHSETALQSLFEELKNILKEHVKDVRVSRRLTVSPACLVTDENDVSLQIQKMFKNMKNMPKSLPILEINPKHPLIQRMHHEQDMDRLKDWAIVLFSQALLTEGLELESPADFVHRLNRLLLNDTEVKSNNWSTQ